jgi:cytochrome c oxidase subunit 2
VQALDPAGPAAAAIARLWWVMLVLGLLVFIGVMAALILALRRRRGAPGEEGQLGLGLVAIGGAIVPAVVILVVMLYNTYVSVDLQDPPTPAELSVFVESNQWWWHVHYPDDEVTTANEIHIPAGEAVTLQLTSDDVIHAFWVPKLQGKRDLMPDHVGQLWLQADRPGTYRGQCAEFCGRQHAKMEFLVIAHEPESFAAWLERHQQPPADPETDQAVRGKEVFFEAGCGDCHAVRGTEASGTLGPDLTLLASRRELGAGTLPNTRENLAAWIFDSQQFKPGNLMPRMPMPDEDLEALLAYLETLE